MISLYPQCLKKDRLMKNEYGIGGRFAGVWFGSSIISDQHHRFFRILLFPIDIYLIFENTSFCFRVHLFRHLKISSIVEIE
jgi:hypothetical protein